MKMFDIFLYLTVFNFMVAILVLVPAFSQTEVQPASGIEIYGDWQGLGTEAATKPTIADTVFIAVHAILTVLKALLNATVLLPWFLEKLLHIEKTNPIIIMFTGLIWINYALGALQIWRSVSIRHME